MPAIRRKFSPRCEQLEVRHCLSYAVAQVGSNLIVTGSSDDTLVVEPNGTGGVSLESTQLVDAAFGSFALQITKSGIDHIFIRGGNTTDMIDLRTTAALTQPLAIDIDTFGGDDVVSLNFTQGISAALNVTVRTGAGDDSLTTYFGLINTPVLTYQANLGAGDDMYEGLFTGTIATGTNFSIFNVHGGTGNDDMQVEGVAANIDANALLYVRLYGDAGDDNITVDFEGVISGKLKLYNYGGAGADRIDLSQTADLGSNGSIDVNVQGMGGNDELTALITPSNGSSATIKGLLDGGTGTDAYAITSNVLKRNVETKLF